MYNETTGLGAVDLAVLQGLNELGAQPDTPHRKSASVVQRVYERQGLSPAHAYAVLCAVAVPWHVGVRLVDFHGNAGGLDPNDKPANPRYTEVRLSVAGAAAVAAARDNGPKLPILLLNGDMWNGGLVPPFALDRVVEAVRRARQPDVSDEELIAIVGPPSYPTECDVVGDIAALVRGKHVQLRCSARVDVDGTDLVLTHFPPGIGPETLGDAIARRFEADAPIRRDYPELAERLELPLRDIRNESGAWNEERIVCSLRSRSDVEKSLHSLQETWPVTVTTDAQLPAPLAALVRGFADDPAAQDPALDALTRQPPATN